MLTRKYQTCLSAVSFAIKLIWYSLELKPAFRCDVQGIGPLAMHGLMPGKTFYCIGECAVKWDIIKLSQNLI